MPFVRRHEELAAVTRVVIAVRAQRLFEFAWLAVRAIPRLEEPRLVGCVRAGPVLRHGDLHELALVDGAHAGFRGDHRGVVWTGKREVEPDRFEIHPADGAAAWFVVHDLCVHRTDIRDRGQLFLRVCVPVQEVKLRDLRLGREEQKCDEWGQDSPDKHVLILSLSRQNHAPCTLCRSQGVKRGIDLMKCIRAAHQLVELEAALVVPGRKPGDIGRGRP